MQVFKGFFAVVRKNLGLMIMYASILVILSATLSNVAPQTTSSFFEEQRIPVTVIDRDGSEVSGALGEYLYERQNPQPMPDDGEAIQDALYHRTTEYVLYIPAGFGASLLEGEAMELASSKVPESYSAAYAEEQLTGYLSTLRAYLVAGFSTAEALENTAADVAAEVETNLNQKEIEAVPQVFYYFNYLCYGLAMVMIFGLSPVLLTFNKKELAARMNASALPLRRKNLQIGLGAFVLALLCLAVFILVAVILYRGDILRTGSLLCILNSVAFLFFSVALGLLVGQVARSGNMISAIANVAVMAMCFLGGVFVPFEIMGSTMQTVAKFMPTYWYLQAVDTAALATRFDASSLALYWLGIGMQLIFGVALLSVALVVSKQKQRMA